MLTNGLGFWGFGLRDFQGLEYFLVVVSSKPLYILGCMMHDGLF